MKGKVFGLVVIAAIGVATLSYFGYLGSTGIIEVKVQYVEYSCGNDNIDMRVIAVKDSSHYDLIGKTISPEINFKPEKLETLIRNKVKQFESDPQASKDFFIIGYVRSGPIFHCSGSLCFKVVKIKYEGENEFTEF